MKSMGFLCLGFVMRRMLSMTLWLLSVLVPLQIAIGDLHGRNTLEYQPAKVAAMEARHPRCAGSTAWTRAPVAAVPIGFGPANMPLGMQIIGIDGVAAAPFMLGEIFQRSTDWHRRTPPAID